jgi:imidazolonepropionase-like amidohydrolase
MRLRLLFSLMCVHFVLAGFANADDSRTAEKQAVIAFVHVNVIPMDRERVLANQTVVIEGDRIKQIGASKSIKLQATVQQIEAKGSYLIPGLVDAHVHLQSQIEFPVYLANGITTVFNLEGRPAHLHWRKQVASGEVLGPAIFSTGPIFFGGRSAAEDVKLVDEQATAGYDAIKIYNTVSKEEYPAIIAEGKRKNMLLMGHVAREPGFALALQSGQSIAHLDEIAYTNFNSKNDDDFDHLVLDDSKIPTIAHQIKAANIYVTPTLNNFALTVQQATDLDAFLKNPELQYVAPWTLENYQPANNRAKNRFGPRLYPVLQNLLATQRKLLKAMNDDGVPLMAGTDATEVGPVAGFGLHHELQEFVEDGFTPYQALATATTTPMRYLRQSAEVGTIEVGKRADLVLLTGNPLSDISNTQKIAGVMVRGRWLEAKELTSRLRGVPAEYQREQHLVEKMLHDDPARALPYLAEHDPTGQLAAFLIAEIASKNATEVVRILQAIRAADLKAELSSEGRVNALGYALISKRLFPQAIAVLTLNTENFPQSANTWDSLADGFFQSGDISSAVHSYQKALETNNSYPNADFAKKFVAEHGGK